MRIHQVNSTLVGDTYRGKWWCVDSMDMDDDYGAVNRYLQPDGTWGKNTEYFDSKEQVEELLKLGHKPDFSMDSWEAHYRRQQYEDMMRDAYESMRDDDRSYDDWCYGIDDL